MQTQNPTGLGWTERLIAVPHRYGNAIFNAVGAKKSETYPIRPEGILAAMPSFPKLLVWDGCDYRIGTGDLLITSHLLYQLKLSPQTTKSGFLQIQRRRVVYDTADCQPNCSWAFSKAVMAFTPIWNLQRDEFFNSCFHFAPTLRWTCNNIDMTPFYANPELLAVTMQMCKIGIPLGRG